MSEPALTQETLVVEMSKLFTPLSADPDPGDQMNTIQTDDQKFDKVTTLLNALGKREWSDRPRLFTVLHLIGRTQDMPKFVESGLKDINLPLRVSRLPVCVDEATRNLFVRSQFNVCTKASDLELEHGRHRHFCDIADIHFRHIRPLGSGGSGTVDHVQSKLSLDEFARKRIIRASGVKKDKETIKTFENELHNLKRLRHIHLVGFVGSYTDPSYFGILMTPIARCNLGTFLAKTSSDGERSLLRQFFGCLCSALHYLHQNNCRHKDIKPQNILVRDYQVLITDFGTALDWTDKTRATTTGYPGPITPRYAAPEVVSGESRSLSSDIWSLGCVYLEMMTVIKEKRIGDLDSFLSNNGSGRKFLHSNSKAVEPWLESLEGMISDHEPLQWIRRMLQPEPRSRPSVWELLELIQEYRDEHPFYGHCCGPVIASFDESSYAGSTLECRDENTSNPSELLGTSSNFPGEGSELPAGFFVDDFPKTESDIGFREQHSRERSAISSPTGYVHSRRMGEVIEDKESSEKDTSSRSKTKRSSHVYGEVREHRSREHKPKLHGRQWEEVREWVAKVEEDRQKRRDEFELAKQAEEERQKRKDEERRRRRRAEKEAEIARLAEERFRKQEDKEDEARRQRRIERRHKERRLSISDTVPELRGELPPATPRRRNTEAPTRATSLKRLSTGFMGFFSRSNTTPIIPKDNRVTQPRDKPLSRRDHNRTPSEEEQRRRRKERRDYPPIPLPIPSKKRVRLVDADKISNSNETGTATPPQFIAEAMPSVNELPERMIDESMFEYLRATEDDGAGGSTSTFN